MYCGRKSRPVNGLTRSQTYGNRQATMLDDFSIITTSGIVLWRKSYAPVSTNVVNSLINDVFVEERQKPAGHDATLNAPYRKDKYTLRWTSAKDVGLIFVVGKSAYSQCYGRRSADVGE